MYDLLTEPLISVRTRDGKVQGWSLPGVFEGLVADTIGSFTALMPHQRHAWFAFLVQLAAVALHRAGRSDLAGSSGEWLSLLGALTPEFPGHEPWSLAVQDLKKPAFMQPPVPEGSLERFKSGPYGSPDELDLLVTAKNHDLKMARIGKPRPAHWLHALVSLQTMEGFSGRCNYGISRMNKGFGSRPCVGVTTGPTWGCRFQRDVALLLDGRDRIVRCHEHYRERDGLALLWLEPWDGQSSLALDRLDPFYLEVCRRARLVPASPAELQAVTAATECARVAGEELLGNTGDPWTPIHKAEGKALTVSESGFDYRRLQEILFQPDYEPGLAQKMAPGDPPAGCSILAVVLARGQGKTDGLHERTVPIPRAARRILRLPGQGDRLAELAREQVELAGTLAKKVLKPALLAALQGAPEKLKFDDDRAGPWTGCFDREVDRRFFEFLWGALEEPAETAQTAWVHFLVEAGRRVLREAQQGLPIPQARRYRALAASDSLFEASVRKHLPLTASHGG